MTKTDVLMYLEQLQMLNLRSDATDLEGVGRTLALASAVALVLATDEFEMRAVTTSIARQMEAHARELEGGAAH